MQIKLLRALHDIDAIQTIAYYHQVFADEVEDDILKFHLEPYDMSMRNFIARMPYMHILHEHVYYVCISELVIGYACAYTPKWLELAHGKEFGLYIKQQHRSQNYGRQVIQQLESMYAPPYILSPLQDNQRAIQLYIKLGYIIDETIPSYQNLIALVKKD